MSGNVATLLNDLEQRGKAMPELLQKTLNDGLALKTHLDTSTQTARGVAARVQAQTSALNARWLSFNTQIQSEHKTQTGRLAEASAGLQALQKLGEKHATDLADDAKQFETLLNGLGSEINGLAKTIHGGVDQQQQGMALGFAAIQKAQHSLATTCKKVIDNVADVGSAVKKSAEVCNEAINRLLTGFQKAAESADKARTDLHSGAVAGMNKVDEGLNAVNSQSLGPATLARMSLYVQSVTALKSSATGALYSLKEAGVSHDTQVLSAKGTLKSIYNNHESYSVSKAASAKTRLATSDNKLDEAWKKIPLDKDGNKDTRNLLQKALSLPGFLINQAWESAVWMVKGVSAWVAEHHREILTGIVVIAGVVAAVMLAPVILPVLAAGAPSVIAVVGSGVVAGMTFVGSAVAGIGGAMVAIGGVGLAAAGIGALANGTSPMEMLANLGSTLVKAPGAILYTASRFLTFATKGPNALGLAASILTLNPGPLLATMAVTTTVDAFKMAVNLIDPKRLQPPKDFTTGKSFTELDKAYRLAKLGEVIFFDEDPKSKNYFNDQQRTDYMNDIAGYVPDDPFIPGTSPPPPYKLLEPISDPGQSYRAEVWRTPEGIVVAYRGSTMDNLGQNWAQNVQQGAGWESYGPNSIYKHAVETAEAVQKKYPGEHIELTGQSLGGGLAQFASAATGLKSTTFNSSGVNPLTYNSIGKTREDVHNVNYDVAGQLLDQLQDGMASGGAVPLVFPAAVIPGVGLGLPALAIAASDAQVAGENHTIGARRPDGSDLAKNDAFNLHLWDAVSDSMKYEVNQAAKREGLPPKYH